MSKIYERKVYFPMEVYINDNGNKAFRYVEELRKISGVKYKSQINELIKENLKRKGERGLADHMEGKTREKMISIIPSVEKYNRKLVGVLTIKAKDKLTKSDYMQFELWTSIECFAEWGIYMYEVPIPVDEGEIYIVYGTGSPIAIKKV